MKKNLLIFLLLFFCKTYTQETFINDNLNNINARKDEYLQYNSTFKHTIVNEQEVSTLKKNISGDNNKISIKENTEFNLPKDIYKLNADGTLTWIAESEQDIVYAAKDFDSINKIKEQSEGIIIGEKDYIKKNTKYYNIIIGNEAKVQTYLNFNNNRDKAIETFLFFSDNTDVEINRQMFITPDSTLNIVGTLNAADKVAVLKINGLKLIEYDHSHPANLSADFPSGYNSTHDLNGNINLTPGFKFGDRSIAIAHNNTRFGLYLPATNAKGEKPRKNNNIYLIYNQEGAISTQININTIP